MVSVIAGHTPVNRSKTSPGCSNTFEASCSIEYNTFATLFPVVLSRLPDADRMDPFVRDKISDPI